jgi:hypothetical protein
MNHADCSACAGLFPADGVGINPSQTAGARRMESATGVSSVTTALH